MHTTSIVDYTVVQDPLCVVQELAGGGIVLCLHSLNTQPLLHVLHTCIWKCVAYLLYSVEVHWEEDVLAVVFQNV